MSSSLPPSPSQAFSGGGRRDSRYLVQFSAPQKSEEAGALAEAWRNMSEDTYKDIQADGYKEAVAPTSPADSDEDDAKARGSAMDVLLGAKKANGGCERPWAVPEGYTFQIESPAVHQIKKATMEMPGFQKPDGRIIQAEFDENESYDPYIKSSLLTGIPQASCTVLPPLTRGPDLNIGTMSGRIAPSLIGAFFGVLKGPNEDLLLFPTESGEVAQEKKRVSNVVDYLSEVVLGGRVL